MQNSLSKFHNLSFQSSRFGFYHFSPLNFIFSQLISLFTTRYLLPLFFLVTLLSLFTYSFSINLALCLSLNWVQFLYRRKTTKPTLSASKTSLAFIINPSKNFIPTRKPNTLSQTENVVTVIKVSNHLNPHPSHTIIDPLGKKKKKLELSIITSWSTNHTTATIINKWLHSAIEQCHQGKHPSQA